MADQRGTDAAPPSVSDSERRPRRTALLLAFHVALVGMSGWWLLELSFPFANLTQFFPALGLLVLLAVWLTLVLPLRSDRSVRRSWIVAGPVVGALVLAVALGGLPLRIRWELSQAAFEEFVANPAVANGGDGEIGSFEVIGRFEMELIYKRADEIVFYVWIPNGMGAGGILYAPNGPVGDSENYGDASQLRHIEGPWYWH